MALVPSVVREPILPKEPCQVAVEENSVVQEGLGESLMLTGEPLVPSVVREDLSTLAPLWSAS